MKRFSHDIPAIARPVERPGLPGKAPGKPFTYLNAADAGDRRNRSPASPTRECESCTIGRPDWRAAPEPLGRRNAAGGIHADERSADQRARVGCGAHPATCC